MLSQNRELQPPSKEVQDYTIALEETRQGRQRRGCGPAMIRNWSVRASTGANKADRIAISHAAQSGVTCTTTQTIAPSGWRARARSIDAVMCFEMTA